jgi:putative NIF3 family GTP cyclohydrolase 1 type 2
MSAQDSACTIAEAIRRIAEAFPPWDATRTQDTVKCGDTGRPLRGVVSCFMATRRVLDEAVRLRANLVITHEPLFYGPDEADWGDDPVYVSKRAFLEKHGLVVWKLHDGTHACRPDAIAEGMIRVLGWEGRRCPGREHVYDVGPATVGDLARHLKQSLGIGMVKIAGDPAMACRKAALKVGSPGGRAQIKLLSEPDVDVMITGESPEWETCEYVRDAAAAGLAKALVVLGHANSEEAGVEAVTARLRALLPETAALTYVKAGDPFVFC